MTMQRSKTLRAFSKTEFAKAYALLASRVATMMGRKFEEGDWSLVYHRAKNIPESGWSNLNIDVMYNGLGVEHKMLCVQSNKRIKEYCGTSLMHPAATRSIRIPSTEGDPTTTAREILTQYAELIEQRRAKLRENAPKRKIDLRTGWLLWQESLKEFLYFEEPLTPPEPKNFWAEWKESGGGARKTSKNLWVYEEQTGRKRYSITTSAGAKIQPYFDVPPPNDPGLYYFWVQGQELGNGVVRIWISPTTALLLTQFVGTLNQESLSMKILQAAKLSVAQKAREQGAEKQTFDLAQEVLLSAEAYAALTEHFAGVSDEHRIQQFIRFTAETATRS